jgi:hypothetical protein
VVIRSFLGDNAAAVKAARLHLVSVAVLGVTLCGWCADALLLRQRSPFDAFIDSRSALTRAVDLNGDGRMDEAVLEAYGADSFVQLAFDRDGTTRFLDVPDDSLTIATVDYDHDGDVDVLVASRTGAVTIWNNDGHANFHKLMRPPPLRIEPVWQLAPVGFVVAVVPKPMAHAPPSTMCWRLDVAGEPTVRAGLYSALCCSDRPARAPPVLS